MGKWWRFANAATKYLSSKPNYKYFLKSLLNAARQDKIYQYCAALIKRVAQVDVMRQQQREVEARPMCRSCNKTNGFCEECDPLLQKILGQLVYLKRADCAPESEGGCGARCVTGA